MCHFFWWKSEMWWLTLLGWMLLLGACNSLSSQTNDSMAYLQQLKATFTKELLWHKKNLCADYDISRRYLCRRQRREARFSQAAAIVAANNADERSPVVMRFYPETGWLSDADFRRQRMGYLPLFQRTKDGRSPAAAGNAAPSSNAWSGIGAAGPVNVTVMRWPALLDTLAERHRVDAAHTGAAAAATAAAAAAAAGGAVPVVARSRRTRRGVGRSLNYVDQGVVTPVKDQKECGGCYSFSGLAVLESALLLHAGQSTQLSVQQGIDCTHARYYDGMNNGCEGGHPYYVLYYAESTFIVDDSRYRYKNRLQPCNMFEIAQPTTLTSVVVLLGGSDDALIQVLHAAGPVSVAVAAQSNEWKYYGGGVISNCSGTPEHAVLLVGYRKSDDALGSYWIVKNSWGSHWGEKGFARLRMGACDLTQDNAVAVLL